MCAAKDWASSGRELERRRERILCAAWQVAEAHGFIELSLERVARSADLARASLQSAIGSLEDLLCELGEHALLELGTRLSAAETLAQALDVPARFAREQPAMFALLFSSEADARPEFASERLSALRRHARALLGRLERLSRRHALALPADKPSSIAFLSALSLAAAAVPALRDSTTLRHRWHDFCLGSARAPT